MSTSTTTAAVPTQGAAAPPMLDGATPLERAIALLRAAAPNALDDEPRAVWDVQRALLLADLGLPPMPDRTGPRRLA